MINDDDDYGDDDDDDDEDELFFLNGWPTKSIYALFPAGTIVRYSHHHKSLTHCKQGLSLHRIWVRLCWMKFCSSDNHYV